MENGKDIARWQIICGEYAGPERRATDILYGEMAPYAPIPRILVANVAATATNLDTYNLVLVGTRQSNPLIAKLVAEEDVPANGYLVRVIDSPFGENLQVVLHRGRQCEQLRHNLGGIGALGLHRGQQHPVEGKEHHQRPQAQEAVDDDVADEGIALRPFFNTVEVHDIAHETSL